MTMAEQQVQEMIPLQGVLRQGISKSSGRPFTRLEVQTTSGDVVGSFSPLRA
jgi:hypothetical protein